MQLHKRLAIVFAAFALLGASTPFTPSAITVLPRGELVIVDALHGVALSSGGRASSRLVKDFGVYHAGGIAADPRAGNGFVLSQQISMKSDMPMPSLLIAYGANGSVAGKWPVPGFAILSGLAINPSDLKIYCADSRSNSIFSTDLGRAGAPLAELTRVRDAGTLGPLAVDAARRRLLVGDVQRGTILSVSTDTRAVAVLDSGTVAEPVAIAVDAKNDQVYIADAAGRRVWSGSLSKWKLKSMTVSQKLLQPSGVAVAPDGSLWVSDSRARAVWRFDTRTGKTLQTVIP